MLFILWENSSSLIRHRIVNSVWKLLKLLLLLLVFIIFNRHLFFGFRRLCINSLFFLYRAHAWLWLPGFRLLLTVLLVIFLVFLPNISELIILLQTVFIVNNIMANMTIFILTIELLSGHITIQTYHMSTFLVGNGVGSWYIRQTHALN